MKKRNFIKTRNSLPKYSKDTVWHFESPDVTPACRSDKWWQGGYYTGGKSMTDNPKYVTCKKCLGILKERGILN